MKKKQSLTRLKKKLIQNKELKASDYAYFKEYQPIQLKIMSMKKISMLSLIYYPKKYNN